MVNKSYIVEDSNDVDKNSNINVSNSKSVEKNCDAELYKKFGFLLDPEFYDKKRINPRVSQKKGYSEIEVSGERVGHLNKKIILTNKNDENKIIINDLDKNIVKEVLIEGEDVDIFFKNDIPSISKFNYKTMEYDWTNCDDVFERMDKIILKYI